MKFPSTLQQASQKAVAKLKRLPKTAQLALVVILTGMIGTLALVASHAASNATAVEAESGTVSSPASIVSDSTASGGKYVKFGTGSGATAPSSCGVSTAYAPGSSDPYGTCWPGPANTGVPVGVTLKNATNASGSGWYGDSNGNVIITANNAVIDGYLIPGRVDPTGNYYPGFTLKNSKVECIGEDSWCVTMTDHSTVSDVEIGGRGCTDAQLAAHQTVCYSYAAGIWTGPDTSANANTIVRANIHGLTRAVQMDGYTTVQDSWFHDSVFDCAIRSGAVTCGNHSSASFIGKGHGIRYYHNTLSDGSSAVLFGQCYDAGATLGDIVINHNRFIATTEPNGYTSSFGVSIENKQLDQPSTIHITNNIFDKGPWDVGPVRDDGIGMDISGNAYTDGSPA